MLRKYLQKTVYSKLVILLIFIFFSRAANSQIAKKQTIQNYIHIIDSLLKNKNLENLICHDFVGKIDSASDKVYGKVYLAKNHHEIKYVIFRNDQNNQTEYFATGNKLQLILTDTRLTLFWMNNCDPISITEVNDNKVEIDYKIHVNYFECLKSLYSKY